jgi:hypothetical protein
MRGTVTLGEAMIPQESGLKEGSKGFYILNACKRLVGKSSHLDIEVWAKYTHVRGWWESHLTYL